MERVRGAFHCVTGLVCAPTGRMWNMYLLDAAVESRLDPNVDPDLVVGGIIYLVLFVYGLLVSQDSMANFLPVNTAEDIASERWLLHCR